LLVNKCNYEIRKSKWFEETMAKIDKRNKKRQIVEWLLLYCLNFSSFESKLLSLFEQRKYKDIANAIRSCWTGAQDICYILDNSQQVIDIIGRSLMNDIKGRQSKKRPNTDISDELSESMAQTIVDDENSETKDLQPKTKITKTGDFTQLLLVYKTNPG
jgi:hypothetical protein